LRQQLRTTQKQDTTLRIDPKVVVSSYLLQLGRVELEQAVESELAENPALERIEEEEPLTEEAILSVVAPQELRPGSDDFEFKRSIPMDDEHTLDWLDLATTQPCLTDHLEAQLLHRLDPELRELGRFLIGSIDEKGYLKLPLEEIALSTGRTLEEAEAALALLHQCEPRGVGARTVEECLLLQLEGVETIEGQLARAIIATHLNDFISRRKGGIMRRYRVLPEVIESAFAEILALSPFPALDFAPNGSRTSSRKSVGVSPDLRILRSVNGWEVEIVGVDPRAFKISRSYISRLKELQGKRSMKDERRHLTEYVGRAGNFIHGIEQRRENLRKIGNYLIAAQSGFLSTGRYEFLMPLTRTQMAKEIGVHESTVSRATMGKFVEIPTGEVISFDVFFKPALRVQKMIEEILLSENPNNPLSDEQIMHLLEEKGVKIARRTVNKYRDRTKLLSSRKRRTA
jgi:RNA polymerase sigma-54 factor